MVAEKVLSLADKLVVESAHGRVASKALEMDQ